MSAAAAVASRAPLAIVGFGLAAVALAVAGIALGPVRLGLAEVLAALVGEAEPRAQAIVATIRAPRVALAAAVGAGLALSGMTLQGVLRNPLADPGLIGVTAGGALGAVATIVLGGAVMGEVPAALRPWLLPAASFVGAAAATGFVFAIARRGGATDAATIVLAGVAVNAIAGAGLGLMIYASDDQQLRDLTFWTMGGLGGASWQAAGLATLCIAGAEIGLLRLARALDLMQLGERAAWHAGVEVERVKRAAGLLSALAVGAGTAVAGPIGFVGLVAPHIARLCVGPGHRLLAPAAALLGAALLLGADLAVRLVVPPAEPPVGLATSLIGGPFFLWLLMTGCAGMLEARGVRLRRGGREVLAGVDLALAPGELVALVGPNGAGNSSLFAVLAGELVPERGAAMLDGRPLAGLGAAALAAERAALEQAPSLAAAFTVAGLVGLGLAAVPRAAVDEAAVAARAMAAAGVAGLAQRRADRLSGGERARAHLARVLAQLWTGRAAGGGRFLLLDEPTASLDLAHQIAVMRVARAEAAAGAGVLAVLHDLNLAAAFADRVLLVAEGRAVAEGDPEAVLESRRLSEVYGAAISVERGRSGALRIAPDLGGVSRPTAPC